MAAIEGRPVGILGTGMRVPEMILTNADLEKIVDTSDSWIVERTGISERRIASETESNADLASAAALAALAGAGVSPEDVDMIVVGTNSPDRLFPGVGPTIQEMIGAKKAGAMDIQAGCPGALYGMGVAAGGIASGMWDKVLVVGSEVISRFVDWTDRNTCVLFGDGAAACLMGPWQPGMMKLTHADFKADGAKSDMIELPAGLAAEPASPSTVRDGRHFVKMKGNDVFRFVNREMPGYLQNFCEECGIGTGDVDWWIFHQANMRIVDSLVRRLELDGERAIVNIARYGNTCAASILLALHEGKEDGRICGGQKILMTIFGAGMTYGAILIES